MNSRAQGASERLRTLARGLGGKRMDLPKQGLTGNVCRMMTRPLISLLACGLFSFASGSRAANLVADLPLLNPDVCAYQVSSHHKKGLNGDGGWFLHEGEAEREGLAGWANFDAGATAEYTKERVHDGHGALVHTIQRKGLASGWRSVRKQLSGGLNFENCDRLSMFVWPTHADGGVDYAVRIDSGGAATQLDIRDLRTNQWNHVVLDISKIQRQGVEAFWLLFRLDWGAADGMRFLVDDICFLQKDGTSFAIDDFETGVRCAVLFDAAGPGSIRMMWGLGEHDLRIEADGQVIVDALQDDFFQGRVPGFPTPLVRKALVASGPWQCVSHWSFVPIGFLEQCRVTTRHPSPFYHVIAERYRDPRSGGALEPRPGSFRAEGGLDKARRRPERLDRSSGGARHSRPPTRRVGRPRQYKRSGSGGFPAVDAAASQRGP